jgi:serine protease Do
MAKTAFWAGAVVSWAGMLALSLVLSAARAEEPATPVVARPAAAEASSPAASLDEILSRGVPAGVAELKLLEEKVRQVTAKVVPSTVGVRIGSGQGSGVIISADGYVLTAAHVVGKPGRDLTLVLHDGRTIKGKSLGVNHAIDAGLIKISEQGSWPHLEMGSSGELREGQWCLAFGHPGGFQRDRQPVLRAGRVLVSRASVVMTDAALVGGDSGGPLVDLEGRVIGIHSRIGSAITANMHVPVDTYRETWDRLAAGEDWGAPPGQGPFLGVVGDTQSEGAKILEILPDSPAAKANIQAGDVITRFDGREVKTFAALVEMVAGKKPGDKVALELLRGEATLKIEVVIGKRGN